MLLTVPVSQLKVSKRLGWATADTADVNWAEEYSVTYDIILSSKIGWLFFQSRPCPDWRDIGLLVGNDCFCIICFLVFFRLYLLNCLYLNLRDGSPSPSLLLLWFLSFLYPDVRWESNCVGAYLLSRVKQYKTMALYDMKMKSGVISWISSKNVLYGNKYQHCYNSTVLLFSSARGMLEVTVSLFWQVLQP